MQIKDIIEILKKYDGDDCLMLFDNTNGIELEFSGFSQEEDDKQYGIVYICGEVLNVGN